MINKIFPAALLMTALSGCSLSPAYVRPGIETPQQWSETFSAKAAPVTRDWWTNFGSEELNNLMKEALAENIDLKASVQRVEQARASLKADKSGLFPAVNVNARASKTEDGDNGEGWNAGSAISYELDLFGGAGSAAAAGSARLAGQAFTHDALKLVVMGDVAQTYFNLLTARERYATADRNVQNAQDLLSLIHARYEAGADSALEVAQQSSALESARASCASLEAAVRTTENALAILLGKPPQTIGIAGSDLEKLNVPSIDAGIPSHLLNRRPDIRAAEADLVAAHADIGVARAALYPSVTLGLDWSVAASSFGNPAEAALALVSSMAAPVFQGGRLEAGVEQATARQKELLETYRQTVLISFREVEDALAAIKAAQLREAALASAMEEAQTAYDLSEARYKAGAIDFQTLLNTQTVLFQARDARLQAKNERLSAAVELFRAVGGGWGSS
jgi:NodT family efflux transporter outer membrane factor (OMF) lipoprotein